MWRCLGLLALVMSCGLVSTGMARAQAPSTKMSNWPNSPVRHTLKQTVASTEPSFTENLRGNVLAVGNTLETCPQNLAASRRHRRGRARATEPCLNNNNNDENMVYVNVDPSGEWFDSSTATLYSNERDRRGSGAALIRGAGPETASGASRSRLLFWPCLR